jgi:hypothetical protein
MRTHKISSFSPTVLPSMLPFKPCHSYPPITPSSHFVHLEMNSTFFNAPFTPLHLLCNNFLHPVHNIKFSFTLLSHSHMDHPTDHLPLIFCHLNLLTTLSFNHTFPLIKLHCKSFKSFAYQMSNNNPSITLPQITFITIATIQPLLGIT